MEILFIMCLALFIIQIIVLVKTIKKKEKKYWISIFCLEIFPIIFLMFLFYYYEYLAPSGGTLPGFKYIGEELICIGSSFIYFGMFCITIIASIIVFEHNQKLKKKHFKNPLILIIASAFIIIGYISLLVEVIENWGNVETIGTVVDFKEIKTGNGIESRPIIQFEVDGKRYKNEYCISDVEIGDSVKIYYSAYGDSYKISYSISNKIIWIPSFTIGLLIIFLRFRKDILNKKD